MRRSTSARAGPSSPASPFHSYGFDLGVLRRLLAGTTLRLEDAFVPRRTLIALAGQGSSVSRRPGAVPLVCSRLAFPGLPDLSGVRWLLSCTAPLAPETVLDFPDRFGTSICQHYGSSETGAVTTHVPSEVPRRPASVGRPMAGVQVSVVDADGGSIAAWRRRRSRRLEPAPSLGAMSSAPRPVRRRWEAACSRQATWADRSGTGFLTLAGRRDAISTSADSRCLRRSRCDARAHLPFARRPSWVSPTGAARRWCTPPQRSPDRRRGRAPCRSAEGRSRSTRCLDASRSATALPRTRSGRCASDSGSRRLSRQAVEQEITRIVRDELFLGSERPIPPDTALGELGVGLDSLALVSLLAAVEDVFTVDLPDDIWTRPRPALARTTSSTSWPTTPTAGHRRPQPTATPRSSSTGGWSDPNTLSGATRLARPRRLGRFAWPRRRSASSSREIGTSCSSGASTASRARAVPGACRPAPVPAGRREPPRRPLGPVHEASSGSAPSEHCKEARSPSSRSQTRRGRGRLVSADGDDDVRHRPAGCLLRLLPDRGAGRRGRGIGLALVAFSFAVARERGFRVQLTYVREGNTTDARRCDAAPRLRDDRDCAGGARRRPHAAGHGR